MIRLFTVLRLEADAPVKNIKASWKECSPETVASFSAVGYFFGRDLYKARNVPVGLIHSSVGGTPAESWVSEATLKSDPEFKSILDAFGPRWDQYQKAQAKYNEELAKAKAEGKPAPRAPGRPWKPTALYNGMIAPLIPYAIRGAIWYQGESNANRAYQYRTLFPALIRNWRADWGEGDFPFLFVQLAAFGPPAQKPEESDWAELREAQLLTLSTVPNTGMAVTTDVGAADIHPPNKQPVGARLALAARAIAYHEPIVYSGPIYQSMKVDGNKIILSFKHTGSGLVADEGGALKGFTIAGADKVWHEAQAEIQGERVVVTSPNVSQPVAVRYAWTKYPVCNLFNKEGLPTSPFRTDQWPGVTQPKLKQNGAEH
jgi:sialate O-acetylesterase